MEDEIFVGFDAPGEDVNVVEPTNLGELEEGKVSATQGNEGGTEGNVESPVTNVEGGTEGGTEGTVSEYEAGTQIQYGEDIYTIDENGNMVDKENNVFKEAKDVKAFLSEKEIEDKEDKTAIEEVIEEVGVKIKSEDDKEVEYESDAKGIATYVKDVVEFKVKEATEAAFNKFYSDYPIVKDFVNHLKVTGGDYTSFNQIKDRSTVTIDRENKEQLKSIIREAFSERNSSISDKYLTYLEESGELENEAAKELTFLQEQDKKAKEEREEAARQADILKAEESAKFWKGVEETVKSRDLGLGLEIPESFYMQIDGKKIAATPNDFLKAITQKGKDGKTLYQRQLDKIEKSRDQERSDEIKEELASAFMLLTGGNYRALLSTKNNKDKVIVIKKAAAKAGKSSNQPIILKNKKDENGDIVFE